MSTMSIRTMNSDTYKKDFRNRVNQFMTLPMISYDNSFAVSVEGDQGLLKVYSSKNELLLIINIVDHLEGCDYSLLTLQEKEGHSKQGVKKMKGTFYLSNRNKFYLQYHDYRNTYEILSSIESLGGI